MRPSRRLLLPTLLLLAVGCGDREHVARNAFVWTAPLEDGATLHVRNVRGSVSVRAGTGTQAVVRATKRWRRGDADDVGIVAVREGRDAVVCTLYDRDATCSSTRYEVGGERRWMDRILDLVSLRSREAIDMAVAYEVVVPPGARTNVQTVSGRVEVLGVQGGVHARTVNGSVNATNVGGPVVLRSVNGSLTARIDRLGAEDEVELKTVNGAATATLPPVEHARVRLSVVNGRVSSELPMTTTSSSRRGMEGTIGRGGRLIELESVNGAVTLRGQPATQAVP